MSAPGFCECGCEAETRLAPKTDRSKGWIKGRPLRYVKGHNDRKPVRYIEEDRGHDTPCWIWCLCTDGGGYGQTKVGGRAQLAHRVYYERHVGPIPDGLELDHLCRVRNCVNPDHLEPVTSAVNTQRGNSAKLTAHQADAIRISAGSDRAVARQYGVSHSAISNIRHGRRWATDDRTGVAA
jgi:hypothetical protein